MQNGHALRVPLGMTVGDRVRLARMAIGYTVAEMAEALGLSKGTYERIEQGQREPRRGELIAIAHITAQDLAFFAPASLAAGDGGTTVNRPRQRVKVPAAEKARSRAG